MDNAKVEQVLKAINQMETLNMGERLPSEFYKLNQAEQSEVIRRIRLARQDGTYKPFGETK